jgi:hypothetical protein
MRLPSTSVPLRLELSMMFHFVPSNLIEACSLDTDAWRTATSTRGSRPILLPSPIA